MRQSIRSEANIGIWIEESQLGHSETQCKNHTSLKNQKAPICLARGAASNLLFLERRTGDRRSLVKTWARVWKALSAVYHSVNATAKQPTSAATETAVPREFREAWRVKRCGVGLAKWKPD